MNKILLSIILLSSMNLFSSNENDSTNYNEPSDLHTACLEANLNAVTKCLARGDSPTAYDFDGKTPVYYLLKDIVTCTTNIGWFSYSKACEVKKDATILASILQQLKDKAKIDLLNSKIAHDSYRTVQGEVQNLQWSLPEDLGLYQALFNELRKHGIDLLPDQAHQAQNP